MQNNISFVEDIVRSYPELLEKMRVLRYGERVGRGRDPTATAALVTLPREEQRRYTAVYSALQHTRKYYDNGQRRLALIRATYFGAPFSAELDSVTAAQGQEWKNDFLRAVVEYLDLTTCKECIYWRRLYSNRQTMACHFCCDTGQPRRCDETRCFSKKSLVLSDPNDEEVSEIGEKCQCLIVWQEG